MVPLEAEEPDLLHDLSRDPARGDVRHTAARECQTGVGDVHLVRENRHPHGVHGLDRGADEMENDIEVVDHQIEDDIHIRAPFEKRVEAVGFDEEGLPHHGAEGRDGRAPRRRLNRSTKPIWKTALSPRPGRSVRPPRRVSRRSVFPAGRLRPPSGRPRRPRNGRRSARRC